MTAASRPRRRWRRVGVRLAVVVGVAILAAVVAILSIRRHIERSTAAFRHPVAAAPARPVAIVLGANVWGDRPSHLLEDRLQATLDLYRQGKVGQILVSGAHHSPRYDEVSTMRRWLEARGVPPDDIFVDHAGLRTFDSMVRAKEIFGVDASLVVTNAFHLPRAVYIGRAAGMNVEGVAAPALRPYTARTRRKNATREPLAQVLAYLDTHVLGTRPRFGGEPIDMSGSGRVTH
ncbi:MAG: ElyC/SanA/YdcF family protein [Myxococcota bacterium]